MSTQNIFTIERTTGVVTATQNPLLVYNDIIPISVAFTNSAVVDETLMPRRAALSVSLRLGSASGVIVAQALQFSHASGYASATLQLSPENQDRVYLSDGVVWLEIALSEKTGPSSRHTIESLIETSSAGAVDLVDAALTGLTSADTIKLNIANLGTIASGDVILSTTKAGNRAVLSGTAATIVLPATPVAVVHGLDFTTGASAVTVTTPALTRDDGDGATPVTAVIFPALTNCSLRFRQFNGAFVALSAAGSAISIPTSQLASVSNGSALDTVDTTQLARSVDVKDHVAALTLPISASATLAENSDAHLPTQKAVKAYVDANSGGGTVVETMASTEVDFSAGNLFLITLAANTTLTYANLASNNRKKIEIRVTNPSTYTLGYPANTFWPGGTPPVVTTGGKVSRIFLEVDGSTVLGAAALLNYSIDNIDPTITSFTINGTGTSGALLADEALTFGAGGSGGLVTTMSGGAVTWTYSSGMGTATFNYTPSRTILGSETCSNFEFTQPTDGIQDLAGNELADFTGQQAKVANTSTATSYERRENFNSAGASAPTDFSTAYGGGSTVYNSTTSPLEGAQSVRSTGGGFDYTFTSGAVASKWARVIVRPTGGTAAIQVKFRDASNNVCGGIDMRQDGGARIYGGTNFGSITAGTYTWGTAYYLTFQWVKGTGSNAQCHAYISTDTTRPGSPTFSVTGGNNTTNATKLRLEAGGTYTDFDDIIVSDTEIGSNP